MDSLTFFKGQIGLTILCTKLDNDVSKHHQEEIKCNVHFTRKTTFKGLWFLVTGFEHFSTGFARLSPNVLPISQKTVSHGLNCTPNHANVLRCTTEDCKEASWQKISLQLQNCFSAENQKIVYPVDKYKSDVTAK